MANVEEHSNCSSDINNKSEVLHVHYRIIKKESCLQPILWHVIPSQKLVTIFHRMTGVYSFTVCNMHCVHCAGLSDVHGASQLRGLHTHTHTHTQCRSARQTEGHSFSIHLISKSVLQKLLCILLNSLFLWLM
jgi:hypothetical protein